MPVSLKTTGFNLHSITEYYERLAERARAEVERQYNIIVNDVAKNDYNRLLKKRMTHIFNQAVKHFYDDYHPTVYQRTYSMYNIFCWDEDDDGSIEIGFDPSKMSGGQVGRPSDDAEGFYHSEYGLYNQAFRLGWHGGADRIRSSRVRLFGYGPHPDTGTPYWGRKTKRGYWTWGAPARLYGRRFTPLQEVQQGAERIPYAEDEETINRILESRAAREIKLPSSIFDWR